MAETSYPMSTANAGEPEWSKMSRSWWGRYGVVGSPGSLALGVTADGVGTRQVYIAAGVADVLGFRYESDTQITFNAAANATGSTRIDRVVLRYDASLHTVVMAYKLGSTPNTPPALSLTDSLYEVSLAQVSVPNAAVTLTLASIIVDERTWLGLRAVTLASITSPLPADIENGSPVWVSDRKRQLIYAGSVAGLIDPRKPVVYGPGTYNTSNILGGTVFTEATAVTLTIPASTGSIGNRHGIVGCGVYLSIGSSDTVVQAYLKRNGVQVAGAQFVGQSGSWGAVDFTDLGALQVVYTLSVKRISGTGTASWSIASGNFSYIKCTAIPTD